ncbi:MAG: hydroxylase [Pseudomonadota bacterium]
MSIQYLGVVTTDVAGVCASNASSQGIEFGAPDPGLGQARTAAWPAGGMIGIRAPMHDGEEPMIRPYMRVDDIEHAVAAAVAAGATLAVSPMDLLEHGQCAIVFQGDVQLGF